MISSEDIKDMKRYRHIIACMIDHSFGYFTPLAALQAIQAHKKKNPCYCEWYMDIFYKKLHLNKELAEKIKKDTIGEMEKALYRNINKDIIKNSLRYRKYKDQHKVCLAIVDRNIKGNESIGASWF